MNKKIITVILFLSAIVGIVFLWPKYQELNHNQKLIVQMRSDLQNVTEYYLNIENLFNRLEAYSEDLSKIESALPSRLFAPVMYRFFKNTSSQSGLILENINEVSSSPMKEKEKIKEHIFSLSLIGSYGSFKSFLFALENTARLIEIQSISLSSSGDKEEPIKFELNVKTHSY